jgi:hypothetical protein
VSDIYVKLVNMSVTYNLDVTYWTLLITYKHELEAALNPEFLITVW